MSVLVNLVFLAILLIIIILFLPKILEIVQVGKDLITTGSEQNFNFTVNPNAIQQNVSFGPIINYTLSQINRDRDAYGLSNVSLSAVPSAQQHADSMLQYGYFSHWDIYDMKPYMRYTLEGGTESVEENIAYSKSEAKACLGSLCSTYGTVNVTSAINNLEYNMMYNDSICCNNGHRDNILNPFHNQVSIGVAYNSTTIYLVEDFINNYIAWLNNTPSFSGNEVYLKGVVQPGYKFSNIEISYDSEISNMTVQQLDQTSDYSYGQAIAGVVGSPLDYYPSLITIDADNYYINNNDFLVSFNMQKAISQYGPGEYTVMLWLNDTQLAQSNSFIGGTYTIFVNSNDTAYVPSHV